MVRPSDVKAGRPVDGWTVTGGPEQASGRGAPGPLREGRDGPLSVDGSIAWNCGWAPAEVPEEPEPQG